jgi:hypothetical protein
MLEDKEESRVLKMGRHWVAVRDEAAFRQERILWRGFGGR